MQLVERLDVLFDLYLINKHFRSEVNEIIVLIQLWNAVKCNYEGAARAPSQTCSFRDKCHRWRPAGLELLKETAQFSQEDSI